MNGQVRVTFIKDDFNKIVELTNISIQNTLEDETEVLENKQENLEPSE